MWMDIAQQEVDQEARSDEEDTVYDRTNPFRKNSMNGGGLGGGGGELRVMLDDEGETPCGIWSWRPICLQRMGNKTVFSIVFTICGVIQASFWSFYTANISTVEKRFRFDSTTSGVLLFANELAQILVAIIFTYFGFRRHRAKILVVGVCLSSLSCFLMASPHFFLGSGELSQNLVRQSSSKNNYVPSSPEMLPAAMPLIAEDVSQIDSLPTSLASVLSNIAEETTAGDNLASTFEDLDNQNVTEAPVLDASVSVSAPNSSDSSEPAALSQSEINSSPPPTSTNAPTQTPDNYDDSEEYSEDKDAIDNGLREEEDNPATEVGVEGSSSPPEPQFPFDNDEMTRVWPMCSRFTEPIDKYNKTIKFCERKEFEHNFAFSFFFVANFIGGVAFMLFLLSGGPFAEDSTILPNELPRIFGITLALRLIGPFFGYLFAWSCLSEFISPRANVVQYDSRWLGAWWLGWTFLSIFMAVVAFVFALFPRQSPREFLKKRSLTHETGATMLVIPNVIGFFGGAELKAANTFPSIINIASVVQGLFRNKVYFLLTVSSMLHIFVGVGYWTFFPKYLEFMFRLKSADAAIITGVSSVPFQVAGLMLGGAFISRYLPSAKEITSWSCISTGLQIGGLLVVAFMGCRTDRIDVSFRNSRGNLLDIGTTELNTTTTAPSESMLHCGHDCACDEGPILPICDVSTGTTYYSPCDAGCERVENETLFLECSCLPFENVTLVEGFCPVDDCSNGLIAFLVLTCVFQFISSSGIVGRMLIAFKSIQADQRTQIIGFTMLVLSLVATIPSPIVFGSIFESACIVREDTCSSEDRGNCWLYDDASLRFAYNLSAAAILLLAFAFDVLLWRSQKLSYEVRIYDGELTHQPAPTTEEPSTSSGSRTFANRSTTVASR